MPSFSWTRGVPVLEASVSTTVDCSSCSIVHRSWAKVGIISITQSTALCTAQQAWGTWGVNAYHPGNLSLPKSKCFLSCLYGTLLPRNARNAAFPTHCFVEMEMVKNSCEGFFLVWTSPNISFDFMDAVWRKLLKTEKIFNCRQHRTSIGWPDPISFLLAAQKLQFL